MKTKISENETYEIPLAERVKMIMSGEWKKLENKFARKIKYSVRWWCEQDYIEFEKWIESEEGIGRREK